MNPCGAISAALVRACSFIVAPLPGVFTLGYSPSPLPGLAHQACKWSPWSAAFYRSKREAGFRHQAAVRALAFKWIRLLFYLWKTGTIDNENLYIQQLRKRNSPILKYLENP